MGYYCVDNLPIPLVEQFVDFTLQSEDELEKVAVSIDIRNSNALSELEEVLERIRQKGIRFEILFLEAEDSVLVKRYKETRRSHPLAGGGRIDKGIGLERKKLAFLKEQADYIIDTSRLLQRELKAELERIFVRDEDYRNLYITVLSSVQVWNSDGFRPGIRCAFSAESILCGRTPAEDGKRYREIQDFGHAVQEAHEFLDQDYEDMIKFPDPELCDGRKDTVSHQYWLYGWQAPLRYTCKRTI